MPSPPSLGSPEEIPFPDFTEASAPEPDTRAVPRDRVHIPRVVRPARGAGTEFREAFAHLRQLDLRLDGAQSAKLAAIVTMARLLAAAVRDFYVARNRGNDVLDELHRLLNTRGPWSEADTLPARQALAKVADDPVLTVWRISDHVALGIWPIAQPNRLLIQEFARFLACPDGLERETTLGFLVWFKALMSKTVATTSEIFVDVDGLQRFLLTGGRNLQAEEAARWTVWAVMAFLESARGSRRNIGVHTDLIIGRLLPEFSGEEAGELDVIGSRQRAWSAYFGGRTRTTPDGRELDCSQSPLALWATGAAAYAERLALLP